MFVKLFKIVCLVTMGVAWIFQEDGVMDQTNINVKRKAHYRASLSFSYKKI